MTALALGAVPGSLNGQRTGTYAWGTGTRGEYVSVGGKQLEDSKDGVGVNVFLSRRMSRVLRVELGISASFHEVPRLVLRRGDATTGTEALVMAYVRPTLQLRRRGSGINYYLGTQLGVVGGAFQNASGAILGGGSGGVEFPVTRRLAVDVGVTANVLYVVNNQAGSGSAWGRTLALRSGMVIYLDQQ